MHFGQRLTFAAATTCARLFPPGGGAVGGLDVAAWGAGLGAGAAAGFGAGFVVGDAVGVAGTPGFAGVVGGAAGAAGFWAAGATGAAGAEGFGAAGAGAGTERSSSQIAAHTPQVWILLVDALHGCGPQVGQ